MRCLMCLGSFILLAALCRPVHAQVPSADAVEPDEEIRAIPDAGPASPPVVPAIYSRTVRTVKTRRPVAVPADPSPREAIPAGKFGLQLNDGTRLIGRPGDDWSLSLKTAFGTSTIPLPQVKSILSKNQGRVTVFLTNGDRLTGTLLAKSISYVTKFGTLKVPSSALVALQRGGNRTAKKPRLVRRPTPANPRVDVPAAPSVDVGTVPLPPPAAPPADVPPVSGISIREGGFSDSIRR